MENALCRDPRITQAWVTGEGQAFLSAVVVMEGQASEDELLASADRLLHDFPGYARIKRIHVEIEPWTRRAEC